MKLLCCKELQASLHNLNLNLFQVQNFTTLVILLHLNHKCHNLVHHNNLNKDLMASQDHIHHSQCLDHSLLNNLTSTEATSLHSKYLDLTKATTQYHKGNHQPIFHLKDHMEFLHVDNHLLAIQGNTHLLHSSTNHINLLICG